MMCNSYTHRLSTPCLIHNNCILFAVVLSLDDALKLAELYEEKWFEIGKELKLSIEVLSRIWDKFFLLSPEKKRLREMLKEWLASSANPTQDDLVAALKSFRVAGMYSAV